MVKTYKMASHKGTIPVDLLTLYEHWDEYTGVKTEFNHKPKCDITDYCSARQLNAIMFSSNKGTLFAFERVGVIRRVKERRSLRICL